MTNTVAADPESLAGHYAGSVTRLAAAVIDGVISVGAFAIALALTRWVLSTFARVELPGENGSWFWLIPLLGWLFIYFWYCYALAGKTPGKAIVGLRVVRGDGADLGSRRAAIRVLALPLDFLLFGLGFVGIVFGRRRRALHDVIAGSVVVYDWDARAARLRFLARRPPVPESQ